MEQSVESFDLMRMFFGDADGFYFFEILFRTLVIYIYALLLLRWLGSRTIGQLSTVEFLLVIALGSAVGDPMFQPDVPLLHAMAVITIVVLANKGLDILISRFKRVERAVDGKAVQMVRNGVLCEITGDGELGASETYQKLRQAGVRQLGEVEYAFVEPNGAMSIFKREKNVPPGLPIVPPWEVERPKEIRADGKLDKAAILACLKCGTTAKVASGKAPGECPHCSHDRWTIAQG